MQHNRPVNACCSQCDSDVRRGVLLERLRVVQCVGEREVGNFSVSAANLETFLTRRFPSAPTILHLHPCTPPLPFLATACAVKTTHHKSWSASWDVVSKIAHCNIAAFRRGVFGHDAVPHLSLADGTSRSTNADVPRCTWISTRVFGVPTILRTTSLACMPVTSSPFTPAIVSPTCACTRVGTNIFMHQHTCLHVRVRTSAHGAGGYTLASARARTIKPDSAAVVPCKKPVTLNFPEGLLHNLMPCIFEGCQHRSASHARLSDPAHEAQSGVHCVPWWRPQGARNSCRHPTHPSQPRRPRASAMTAETWLISWSLSCPWLAPWARHCRPPSLTAETRALGCHSGLQGCLPPRESPPVRMKV